MTPAADSHEGQAAVITEAVGEDRLRNTRAWAKARCGQLSGADVIVSAIDELLALRAEKQPTHSLGTAQAVLDQCRSDYHGWEGDEDLFQVHGRYTLAELEALLVVARGTKP